MLQTDEDFDYVLAKVPPQGRWRIYGINLPETVLRKVYFERGSSTESGRVMRRFTGNLMRDFAIICGLLFVVAQLALAADDGVIESTKASQDMAPSTDPTVPFWQVARPVYADKDRTAKLYSAIARESALAGQKRVSTSCLSVLTKN